MAISFHLQGEVVLTAPRGLKLHLTSVVCFIPTEMVTQYTRSPLFIWMVRDVAGFDLAVRQVGMMVRLSSSIYYCMLSLLANTVQCIPLLEYMNHIRLVWLKNSHKVMSVKFPWPNLGIAWLCCDARRQVRMQALTYLQRALLVHDLQTLDAAEWESCFNKVRKKKRSDVK